MNSVLEEMCAEAAYNEKLMIARQLLENKVSPEIVSKCIDLSPDVVMELAGIKYA